jgi:hypothetical protein
VRDQATTADRTLGQSRQQIPTVNATARPTPKSTVCPAQVVPPLVIQAIMSRLPGSIVDDPPRRLLNDDHFSG